MTTEKITWEEMVKIEPGLLELYKKIKAEKVKDNHYCAIAAWYGGGVGFKSELTKLVGWGAKDERLKNPTAYDLAYDKLFHSLPDCKNCGCMSANQIRELFSGVTFIELKKEVKKNE